VRERVRHGLTNARIAALPGVSADAVKFHVATAALKPGLGGKAALKRWDGVSRASALHERKDAMTTDLGAHRPDRAPGEGHPRGGALP